jgi:elongation factor 1 alpha-like protein
LNRAFLRHTGTTPKKKKPAAAANGDKLADSVEKLAVDEPKVKSKNLNVLDEFQKSGMKRMANFVVVGMYSAISMFYTTKDAFTVESLLT